jgi:hypothetical protein
VQPESTVCAEQAFKPSGRQARWVRMACSSPVSNGHTCSQSLGKTGGSHRGQHRLGRGKRGRGDRWGDRPLPVGATIPGWCWCAGVGPSRAKWTPPGRRHGGDRERRSRRAKEASTRCWAVGRRRGPRPTPLRGQPDAPRGPRDAEQPGDASPWSAWARKLAVSDQYQQVPTEEHPLRRPVRQLLEGRP